MTPIATLKAFSARLRELPTVLAAKAAQLAADEINEIARRDFEARRDPYGVSWLPGHDGQAVTLHRSGALEDRLYYVPIGSKLRVALGVDYAKYQIGKRPVFPKQGAPLPLSYQDALRRAALQVLEVSS